MCLCWQVCLQHRRKRNMWVLEYINVKVGYEGEKQSGPLLFLPVVKLTNDKGALSDHCHPHPSFRWFSPIHTIAPMLASRSTKKAHKHHLSSFSDFNKFIPRKAHQIVCSIIIYCFQEQNFRLHSVPTSDVPVFRQAGDAEQISPLSLAGWLCLTPGQNGVQVELITRLELRVCLPKFVTAIICEYSRQRKCQ